MIRESINKKTPIDPGSFVNLELLRWDPEH